MLCESDAGEPNNNNGDELFEAVEFTEYLLRGIRYLAIPTEVSVPI